MLKTLTRSLLLATALTSASTAALAADDVKFQLDWLPGGDKAPAYVGVQEGFFKDADINVTIASGRGSTDAITKMATGQADAGTADIAALMAARAQDDVPVSVISAYFTQAPHAFFVLDSSPVKTIADLKGKKIATSPFTSSNQFLPLILESNGMKESDIKLVKADAGALGPMLITGNTDAIIAWVTNTALFKQQAADAGMKIRELRWSDGGLSLYSSSLLASDQFLKQRPDVAKRFSEAYLKAVKFTFEHPDKAGEDLHAMVPEASAKVVAQQIRDINTLVFNEITEHDGFGAITPERLAQTWTYVAKANGLDASSLDPATIVDRDFTPEQK